MGVGALSLIFVIMVLYHLGFGKCLDPHHFTRVKIFTSLLQLLILVAKTNGSFGYMADLFVLAMQPLALWVDVQPMACFAELSFLMVYLVNLLLPVLIGVILYLITSSLYRKRRMMMGQNVSLALQYLKVERRIGQFTILFAECSVIPMLLNASRAFSCASTTSGRFLVSDASVSCSGIQFEALRGVGVATFITMGLVFPLVLR